MSMVGSGGSLILWQAPGTIAHALGRAADLPRQRWARAASRNKLVGRARLSLSCWLLLLLCAFVLSGCSNTGSPPPGVSAAVFTVVSAIWNLRKMHDDALLRTKSMPGDLFKDFITDIGQHVKFFLRSRAEVHLKTEADTDKVVQTVAAEYDRVRTFILNTVGLDSNAPSTLITGTDKTPAHIDFSDVLRVRVEDQPVTESARKTQEYNRWQRAMTIAWRAAALEDDLWIPDFSEAAMEELLDRRLRITERMIYQVKDVSNQSHLRPVAAAPHGPWQDGVRVRMFEYPILSASYASLIGAANIGPAGIWKLDFSGQELFYNEGNSLRIRTAAAMEFTSASGTDTYPYDLVPGGDPASAVDHLFTPSDNWWDRSWIYCDHVLAALHIESLRFGKRRRDGSDSTFNAAVNAHPKGWAELRPVLPPMAGDPRLMADDKGKPPAEPRLFANGPMHQVQLGDHVVFWNSIMYGLLSDGAWSLENAIVVGVDSDWAANDIGDNIHLMGHGTGDTLASRYREDNTHTLNTELERARTKAKAAVGDNIPWVRAAAPLVRWAPFGEAWIDERGNAQAPWWIRVPYAPTPDWAGRALGRDATLHTLPDAVEYDPAAGFTTPPPAAGGGPIGAAYFPLWWPPQEGKWKGYIDRRKNGQVPSSFRLEPVSFYKGNIPGLVVPAQFIPGATVQHVYTVRPIMVR